jgi:hypothetical protein
MFFYIEPQIRKTSIHIGNKSIVSELLMNYISRTNSPPEIIVQVQEGGSKLMTYTRYTLHYSIIHLIYYQIFYNICNMTR